MIKQSQMKAILAKIQDDTSENFSTDLQILQDNLSIHIFNDPDVNKNLPENFEGIIRTAASDIMEACYSTCINHDQLTRFWLTSVNLFKFINPLSAINKIRI